MSLFLAESACSWKSECGRYQIVVHTSGFEIQTFRVNVDGVRQQDALTLEKAQDWCRNHGKFAALHENGDGV